ncbi:MAG: DUF2270 domain-containing protein [Verrucomicrobiae bacterium]|nr:DUF2270 domain-containing protein [Verrucomicrobiae bacterium]
MSEPNPETPARDLLRDQCYVNAMAHFYRGEIGRIMVWRQRLDTTTTWAITSTGTIFTVAFSVPDVPHLIFFFNLAIVWVMLWIEARRYRFYDAFQARVRMLEAHFLSPMVAQNPERLEGDWRKLVAEDLLIPSFKISQVEAMAHRLRRNYAFIFMIILMAWLAKIYMHTPYKIDSLARLYEALAVGQIPSWLVAGMILGTFLSVVVFAFYVARHMPPEITEFGVQRGRRWQL